MKTGYIIAIFVLIIFILTVMFFPEKYGLTPSANGMFMQETNSSGRIPISDQTSLLSFSININGNDSSCFVSFKSSVLMNYPDVNSINAPKNPPGSVIYDYEGKPYPFDYYVGKVLIPKSNLPVSNIFYGILTNKIVRSYFRTMSENSIGLTLGMGPRNTSFVEQMGITKIAINFIHTHAGSNYSFISFNNVPTFCTPANILFQSKLMSLAELQWAGFILYDYIPLVMKVSSDSESVQYLIVNIGNEFVPSFYSSSNNDIKISGDVGFIYPRTINHGNRTVAVPDVVTMPLTVADLFRRCMVIDYNTSMLTIYK
jgi:hypothetical protein